MNYLVSAYSDVGIEKKTNQDSVLVQVASCTMGRIIFNVVCDGMGGLEKGELASATMIREFSIWFQNDLPKLLEAGLTKERLAKKWQDIVETANRNIASYGFKHGIQLGTTVVALLIVGEQYYLMNIGDSRAYLIRSEITQLTKDQTFVQREMDQGRMTKEEAKTHPNRNVLLQCVGASEWIEPDFYTGNVFLDDVFLLCSDGFRHVLSEEEIYNSFNGFSLQSEQDISDKCKHMTELVKYRKENDNISVVVAKVIP